MLVALSLHPDSSRDPVEAITVEIARRANGRVMLRYEVTGDIDKLRIPTAGTPSRASELWKHTCFEAFVTRPDGAYDEFNFSPAGSWAAYRFDSYRRGMRERETLPPGIEVKRSDRTLILLASPEFPETGMLGLSAVIETGDGGISYWALAHALGRADFHHSAGFVIDLRYL